ncbi:MAG: DUF58 domain-containing protein [Micrococcales bacterium]|nr:DUF58 domain-containing protein [Micrococcales bacterium]MCL2667843.1 DUF58 domain-containing protein [Micrococcales bacterium]
MSTGQVAPGVAPPVRRRADQLLALRARLSLPMRRRVMGLMEGRHRSVLHGRGQDFDDLSRYVPGDDLSDIDWRSSARAGVPLIKRYVHETTITVVLAVDTGRTMAAASRDGERKSDVALELVRLVALLAQEGGDRLALVAADAGRLLTFPARHGRLHAEALLRRLGDQMHGSAARLPGADLGRLTSQVERRHTRRALVVLVTDEAHPDADVDPSQGEGPDSQALRRLRTRHDVIVASVADADPRSGPDVDDGWTAPTRLLGAKHASAAIAQAQAVRAARRQKVLHHLGVTGLVMTSTSDVIGQLARALEANRAGR